MNDDVRSRLLAIFGEEAEEHLQAISGVLGALERDPPADRTRALLEELFRAVHTLKGAARSVSLVEVEARCQAAEALLSELTRGQRPFTPAELGVLGDAATAISRLIAGAVSTGAGAPDAVASAGAAPAPSTPRAPAVPTASTPAAPAGSAPAAPAGRTPAVSAASAPVAPAPSPAPSSASRGDTIRLATAGLDELLRQSEDLLAFKLAAQERAREGDELARAAARLRDGRRGAHPMAAAESLDALRAVQAQARRLAGQLAGDHRAIGGAVDGILDGLRRLRMAPAAAMLDAFAPMVRSLAGEHGKDVAWIAEGAQLPVDRKVLELIKDPLIHIVRNAIDHGIEGPDARAAAGKPRRGRVALRVAPLEGGQVEIRVEDDGGGVSLERLREAGVRARVVSAEAADALGDDAALELMFHSGLSTSPVITDVSGHGLGMAIVRDHVERLGGRVRVHTHPGVGTAVTMIVPATVATFTGTLVGAGGQRFLVPTSAVERVVRVAPADIGHLEGREAVAVGDRLVPVARLSELLDLPAPDAEARAGRTTPCLVLQADDASVGLLVEEVHGNHEGLVKEFRPPLVRVRHVAAAGLLGSGDLALILRPSDLVASVRELGGGTRRREPLAAPRATPSILVVDDSITTRTMEKNLLEAAGYRVRTAVDGVDAWTLLKSERFDLVLSDVDMPRMSGFDLTARVREDRGLGDLPIVLVTALESREDKERGIEVGANAYIVKSGFDQSKLLETIRRLV